MTQKFETDKEQLAKIALDLEKSIENIKIELEKSEDAGATSIGRKILAEMFKKNRLFTSIIMFRPETKNIMWSTT